MKKTVSAAIGSTNFVIDEDAYSRLDSYLAAFRAHLTPGPDNGEVMNDLENRIAELLSASAKGEGRAVNVEMIDDVISRIGMPDGSTFTGSASRTTEDGSELPPVHKFYRDVEHRSIGGVCSGIAAYFNLDITLVRVLFVALFLCASCGFWLYVVLWIIAPKAVTPTEKCELRGWPPTYENLSKFTVSR
ncbi:MAG: PspC domain-containing protein [Bacteroidales bacterium]|nr:PspC domain-containing protein [Bacteroidales bacterium]